MFCNFVEIVSYFDFLLMLSKNLKCLAIHILQTFLFCFQAVDLMVSDESLANNILAANSLPATSGNGEASDNAP